MEISGLALGFPARVYKHTWEKVLFPEVCLDYPTRSNYRPKEASSSLVPVRGPESESLLLCLNACTFAYWCVCVLGGGVPGIPNTSHLTTKPPCEGLTQQDLEMDPESASCLLLRILTP